jgi:hypothetical protein
MQRSRHADPRAIRLVLFATLVTTLGGCRERQEAPLRVSSAGATEHVAADPRATVDPSRRTAIVDATRRVAPSVVSINVTSHQRLAPRTPWDMFFVPDGSDQLVQSFGT